VIIWLAAIGAVVLAHTAPFSFLLDVTDHTVWRMPDADPPTIYLTFDDGPNPTATPQLLDALARHGVKGTFFIIDKHLTDDTAPIVRRAFEDGHAVALHSHTRTLMFKTAGGLAKTLEQAAARLERLTGHRPCRAFRPHGGNRSVPMLMGAARVNVPTIFVSGGPMVAGRDRAGRKIDLISVFEGVGQRAAGRIDDARRPSACRARSCRSSGCR